MTVTGRRWGTAHQRNKREAKESAGSPTPPSHAHAAGTAAASREGESENTKMLKWRLFKSPEGLLELAHPLNGAKALAWAWVVPTAPFPRSELGSFQKTEMERKGRIEARILC